VRLGRVELPEDVIEKSIPSNALVLIYRLGAKPRKGELVGHVAVVLMYQP
jgi:hypothetical protein